MPYDLLRRSQVDWNDVRHFLALARHGSVRGAGASLGVSHSTIARRVEALEAEFGTRLFDRNRDGYRLTAAGEQMLAHAEAIEARMATMHRALQGQDDKLEGRIRITCCDPYISAILMPALATLVDQHADLELELTTDGRLFDLSKREADIAIRVVSHSSTPPEHLIGRRIAPLIIANYVAREHAHRLDPGLGHRPRWIAFEDRISHQVFAGTSHPDLPVWGAMHSVNLMAQALLQGLGIGILPCYIGESEPGLRRLDPPDFRHMADVWMLSHPDLRNNARLRAAREVIAQAIESAAHLFRPGS